MLRTRARASIRQLIFAALLLLATGGAAHAVCGPVPFIFTDGTPIRATQVNTNFTHVINCYSGSITSPGTTVLNSLALWGNTFGTELKEGNNAPALHRWDFPASMGGVTNAFAVNVGTYTQVQIPVPVLQGISSMVRVPDTWNTPFWGNTAISGYIEGGGIGGPNQSAVAMFSVGTMRGDNGTPGGAGAVWGANFVATNCPKIDCTPGSGFDSGITGLEVNTNVVDKGANPAETAVRGIMIAGGGPGQAPVHGSYAIEVATLSTNAPWLYGTFFRDGAVINAHNINKVVATGDGDSQAVNWKMTTGGADRSMGLQYKQDGYLDFLGNPDLGGVRALNLDARNAIRLSGVDAITLGGGCVNFLNGVNGLMAVCNTTPQNVFRNTTHIFQTLAGAVDVAKLQAAGGADTTGMLLTVNNAAGVNLATVTLGANDSGGVGFKALRVPN